MSATTKTIRRNPLPEVIDTSRSVQRAPFSQHLRGAGHDCGYRPDLARSLIEYLEQIARRLWLNLSGAACRPGRSQAPGVRDEH
jgi:hypothetical protein